MLIPSDEAGDHSQSEDEEGLSVIHYQEQQTAPPVVDANGIAQLDRDAEPYVHYVIGTTSLLDLPEPQAADQIVILSTGQPVIVLDAFENWSKVMLLNGQVGFVLSSDLSRQPAEQANPVPEPTPEPTLLPTEAAKPTASLQPTKQPEQATTPKISATPEPTATPMPTVTPEPTATPMPTVTPEPTATPMPTVTPEPSAPPEHSACL